MPTLEFKGKQHVYAHHLTVPYRPLVPDFEKSHGDNPGQPDDNLIIHGDNLDALKALLPRYAGKVDCIYIDPPYNTGNEGWKYNDNVNSPLMREWLAQNSPVDDEDLERHDKWLCMMWPRLQLLRELLSDKGVIFVSISDHEQHHLRLVMNEVFGSDCFVANFVWHSTKSLTSPALVSVGHTHNFAYCKDAAEFRSNRAQFKLPAIVDGFENPDNDPRGPWKADPFEAGGERPNQMYPITNPNTGEVYYPSEGNCWKNDLARFQELVADNRIVFGKTGRSRPQRKRFLYEAEERGLTPNTWWDDVGTTTNGTTEVGLILGTKVFPNPKPTSLIRKILSLATASNDLVLDSFAGSGSTAHAVLAQNKADGGNRRFILVECEDYADDITAERVRRVVNGIPDSKEQALRDGLGGSFTYHMIGDPIELEAMLSGDALPDYSALAAYLLHTASGISVGAEALEQMTEDGLFYEANDLNYYLLYEPNIEWLRGNEGVLNEVRAKRIEAECRAQKRKAIVFAPAKYVSQRSLTEMRITFCQLPYELHNGG